MFCDKGAVPLKIEQGTLSHQAKVMQKCILQDDAKKTLFTVDKKLKLTRL